MRWARVKAVTAASLAMKGDGTHFVPLDRPASRPCGQTGLDMNERYKETSTGGLAVKLSNAEPGRGRSHGCGRRPDSACAG